MLMNNNLESENNNNIDDNSKEVSDNNQQTFYNILTDNPTLDNYINNFDFTNEKIVENEKTVKKKKKINKDSMIKKIIKNSNDINYLNKIFHLLYLGVIDDEIYEEDAIIVIRQIIASKFNLYQRDKMDTMILFLKNKYNKLYINLFLQYLYEQFLDLCNNVIIRGKKSKKSIITKHNVSDFYELNVLFLNFEPVLNSILTKFFIQTNFENKKTIKSISDELNIRTISLNYDTLHREYKEEIISRLKLIAEYFGSYLIYFMNVDGNSNIYCEEYIRTLRYDELFELFNQFCDNFKFYYKKIIEITNELEEIELMLISLRTFNNFSFEEHIIKYDEIFRFTINQNNKKI